MIARHPDLAATRPEPLRYGPGTRQARAGWATRIAAATPADRDRTVDALRAVAILGVVLGHWLVTAVVADPYRPASLAGASPLSYHPALAPATWFLQTLGPFFAAAGYAAARRSGRSGVARTRWRRLVGVARPVLVLALVWVAATALLAAVGAPAGTRRLVWSLVSHPLWFLLVYLVLTAFAPLLRAAYRRFGLWCLLPPAALVALSDVARSPGTHVLPGLAERLGVPGPPGWVGLVVTPVGWAVPYLLGIALATGRLSRRTGAGLVVTGVGGAAVLVAGLGYPASAVGVPGDGWSNLDPPSLFALALASAQVGAFVVVRPWLARVLRRPACWAPVAALNRIAITVYCWHQSALLLVSFAGLAAGRPAGLLDPPGGGWPWYRLCWLPGFAAALAVLVVVFRRWEYGRHASSA